MEIEDLISGRISNKKGEEVVFSIFGDLMIVSKLFDLIDDFGEEEGLSVRSSLTSGNNVIILKVNNSLTLNKTMVTYKEYIRPLLEDRELDTLKKVINTLSIEERKYSWDLAVKIFEDLRAIFESVLEHPNMQLMG